MVLSPVSPSFLSSCTVFINRHSRSPSAEAERLGGIGKEWFEPPVSPASWFAWPSCNIFTDIPRLCLPSRAEEEHMVCHFILEIIPSLSKRGMISPSFQSINYSCFIVFYYIYELLKIKLEFLDAQSGFICHFQQPDNDSRHLSGMLEFALASSKIVFSLCKEDLSVTQWNISCRAGNAKIRRMWRLQYCKCL